MDKEWLYKENKRLHELSVELEKEKLSLQRERESLEAEKKNFEQQKMVLESGFRTLAADKKAFMDDLKKEWQKRARKSYEENQAPGFFAGITTKNGLKKRYKQLMKIYHPDNTNGDSFTVACINREYQNLMDQYDE